jgi:hypothetical protein
MKYNFKYLRIIIVFFLFLDGITLSTQKAQSQIDAEYQKQQNEIKKQQEEEREIRLKPISICFYQYALSPYTEPYDSSANWTKEDTFGYSDRYYITKSDNAVYEMKGDYRVSKCSLPSEPICYLDKETESITNDGIKTTKCILRENKIILYQKKGWGGVITKRVIAYKNHKWNKENEIQRFKFHMKDIKNTYFYFDPSYWQ